MTPDTIFALSSGRPPAGVAVIRVSGPDSFATAKLLTGNNPQPRMIRFAALTDPATGGMIDKGYVLALPAPGTFTGDDIVEFQIHGGLATIEALLGCLARAGLRHAEPGEFSRRAFDNGKLDLSQAEGLADLIDARTETQRLLALSQAGGQLRAAAERWRMAIIGVMADAEAGLDFSDEADVDIGDEQDRIVALRDEIGGHLGRAAIGERIRTGFTIAVVGEPNVGKSSLVNALARRDVSIISALPGTTRDLIEVSLDLDGIAVTLVDTAGLRESLDPVEVEGIARARTRAGQADLVLHIAEAPPVCRLGQVILNKCDLDGMAAGWVGGDLHVSARTGAGLQDLERWLMDWVRAQVVSGDAPIIGRRRQRDALEKSVARLTEAIGEADPVLRAESLRLAARALDEVTGRVGTDDVLSAIFGRFCIGK